MKTHRFASLSAYFCSYVGFRIAFDSSSIQTFLYFFSIYFHLSIICLERYYPF